MTIKLAKTELIHFVGIGGIGMSGLAIIMQGLGFKIQGSDISNNKNIERLKNRNEALYTNLDTSGTSGLYFYTPFSGKELSSPELREKMLNKNADNWFLQLETFDPHEPFFAPERFREKLKTNYKGPRLDWPQYDKVKEADDEVAELKANYLALVGLCDYLLGSILDYFDENNLFGIIA